MAADLVSTETPGSWQSELFRFILDFFDSDKALIQRTSGTTGNPKTFLLNRDSMIQSAQMTIDRFKLQAGDTALLNLPVRYIAGKMMLVRALLGGLNLLTVKPSGRPLEDIDRQIDFGAMVPLQLFESLKHGDPLNRFGKLLLGGGEISYTLRQDLQLLEHTEVYETFGMSETYTHFAVKRINGNSPDTAFSLLKGVKIQRDGRGCIEVDIPGITNGIVSTNDLVEIKSGDSFEWLGRIDNIINSGGIKINPERLEEKIRKVLDFELVISAIPDPKLGERLILVLESDSERLQLEELTSSLAAILEKHEMPGKIIVIPELPRNLSMKIDRVKLKDILDKKK